MIKLNDDFTKIYEPLSKMSAVQIFQRIQSLHEVGKVLRDSHDDLELDDKDQVEYNDLLFNVAWFIRQYITAFCDGALLRELDHWSAETSDELVSDLLRAGWTEKQIEELNKRIVHDVISEVKNNQERQNE